MYRNILKGKYPCVIFETIQDVIYLKLNRKVLNRPPGCQILPYLKLKCGDSEPSIYWNPFSEVTTPSQNARHLLATNDLICDVMDSRRRVTFRGCLY